MLSSFPKFTLSQDNNQDYKITIFMLIDSLSGPMDVTVVNNLYEFYMKYNSDEHSYSYKMAATLLSYGYRLILKRVGTSGYPISIAIDKSKNAYYPLKDYDYNLSNNMQSNTKLEYNQTFNYNIIFTKDSNGEYYVPDDFYLLLSESNSRYICIYSDKLTDFRVKVPGVIGDANRVLHITEDPQRNIINLISEIKKIGYEVTWKENINNTQLIITLKKTSPFIIPDSSLSTYAINNDEFRCYVDEYINDDLLYVYNESNIIFEIYSKYDSSIEDIDVIITTLYNYYDIMVNKYNSTHELILFTENYRIPINNIGPYWESKINEESNLINVKFKSNRLIPGNYSLGRAMGFNVRLVDYCDSLLNLNLYKTNEFMPDLLLDIGLNNQYIYNSLGFTKDDINKYIGTYYSNLNNLQNKGNIILQLVDSNLTNTISNNCILFNGVIKNKDIYYPSYFYYLKLLGNKLCESSTQDQITIYNTLPEMDISDTKLYYNTVVTDSYYVKLINPIGYLNKSFISADNLVKIVCTTNKARFDLLGISDYSKDEVNDICTESINYMSDLLGEEIPLTISDVEINERNVQVVFNITDESYMSNKYDLDINLSY